MRSGSCPLCAESTVEVSELLFGRIIVAQLGTKIMLEEDPKKLCL